MDKRIGIGGGAQSSSRWRRLPDRNFLGPVFRSKTCLAPISLLSTLCAATAATPAQLRAPWILLNAIAWSTLRERKGRPAGSVESKRLPGIESSRGKGGIVILRKRHAPGQLPLRLVLIVIVSWACGGVGSCRCAILHGMCRDDGRRHAGRDHLRSRRQSLVHRRSRQQRRDNHDQRRPTGSQIIAFEILRHQ